MVHMNDIACVASAGPCKLDMVLYSEEVDSATMAAFYPVNALRNRALKQAKTEVGRPAAERRRCWHRTHCAARQALLQLTCGSKLHCPAGLAPVATPLWAGLVLAIPISATVRVFW